MRPGRDGILEAARDLYLESGLSAVTMRHVASRCGVSATAIYRHFSSGDDLIRHVLRIGFERFREYLSRDDPAAAPRERLLAIAAGYIDFALDYPSDYETMFAPSARVPPHAYPRGLSRAIGKGTPLRRLIDVIEEWRGTGAVCCDDPEQLALFLWSTLHGLVMLYLSGHIDRTAGEFRRISLEQAAMIVDRLLQPKTRRTK